MSGQSEEVSPFDLAEEELLRFAIPSFSDAAKLDNNLPEPRPVCLDRSTLTEWQQDLSLIDTLPLEIQQSILSRLDLDSLASFRLVNRKADSVFRSIPEYRWAAATFPTVLLAIRSIGTGQWITYGDVYNELHRWDCENCGDFTCYLYLFTCRRVCNLCFNYDEKYLPLRLYRAHQKFGISESILLTQPHIRSVPGRYGCGDVMVQKSKLLVDRQSAREIALQHHGSVANMERAVLELEKHEEQTYAVLNPKAAAKGYCWRKRGDMFDAAYFNTYRYMAIVAVPWVNKEEQSLEWGPLQRMQMSYTQSGTAFSAQVFDPGV